MSVSRLSWSNLSEDTGILQAIFEQTYELCRATETRVSEYCIAAQLRNETLLSCGLVCRAWHAVAQSQIDRILVVKEEYLDVAQRWLRADTERAARVRGLYFAEDVDGGHDEEVWDIIERCKTIETLVAVDLPNPPDDVQLPSTITTFVLQMPLRDPFRVFIHSGITLRALSTQRVAHAIDLLEEEYESMMNEAQERDWSALKSLGWYTDGYEYAVPSDILQTASNLVEVELRGIGGLFGYIDWHNVPSLRILRLTEQVALFGPPQPSRWTRLPKSIQHIAVDFRGIETSGREQEEYAWSLGNALFDPTILPALKVLEIQTRVQKITVDPYNLNETEGIVRIDIPEIIEACSRRGIELITS